MKITFPDGYEVEISSTKLIYRHQGKRFSCDPLELQESSEYPELAKQMADKGVDPTNYLYTYGACVRATRGVRETVAQLTRDRREQREQENAALKEKWAKEREAQEAIDEPLRIAAEQEAAQLRKQIEPSELEVLVAKKGDADGDPIYEYSVDGFTVKRSDCRKIGYASAIRPGALGAFLTIPVFAISKDLLEKRKREAEQKQVAQAKARTDQMEYESTHPVPEEARAAFARYRGSAEKAWEAGDESAWAIIRKYGHRIGIDPDEIKLASREAAAEIEPE